MSAEPIEGAVKLLKLNILMGDERRQIVAGIALYYKPDDLIGKTVVVVANLAPIKLRGVESQGMLLAASKGERLRLVTVDGDLSSGAVPMRMLRCPRRRRHPKRPLRVPQVPLR